MSFHHTQLGIFGEVLQRDGHTDLNGFVPETGDQVTDFYWPAEYFTEWDEYACIAVSPEQIAEDWAAFVAEAVAATAKAVAALHEWQEGEK